MTTIRQRNERIEPGDVVDVYYNGEDNCVLPDAVVVYGPPVATGDAWVVRGTDGTIHYIQTYESIVLKTKGAEPQQ